MPIHAAKLERSRRLQRVLEVLTALPVVTSKRLQELADTCAPATCVSELRQAGYRISCKRKGEVWEYRLLGREVQA